MLRYLLFFLGCFLLSVNMAPALAGDKNEDWVSGSVLEELWTKDKLKDISQKVLREELLDDAAWWQFSTNQWRALDNEQCTFASEPMLDVLFVWQQFPVSNTVKANEGEAGLVMRLTHISSLMYLRKGSEEQDIDPAAGMPDSIVKNLTSFFKKNPLKDKSSKKRQSNDKKQANEAATTSDNWKWVTKEGTAVLKVGYVMIGRKMVVDHILLTLIPVVKRAPTDSKTSTASKNRDKDKDKEKEKKDPIKLETIMLDHLSECIMHNADKLRPLKEDDEDYALPATLAFLDALQSEARSLHDYMISIRGRGNLVGPKAWAQLKQDIKIIERNERGTLPDKHDKVIGYAEWDKGFVISRAYASEKEWVNHYNLSVQRIKRDLPVAERKQIVYLNNKQDYTTDQISPKVLLRMKHDHRENFQTNKPLFNNRNWSMNRPKNDIKNIKLWLVTLGLIEEDGHKEGLLRTNVRVLLKENEKDVEYIEFRRSGIYRATMPKEDAYLISEYYGL